MGSSFSASRPDARDTRHLKKLFPDLDSLLTASEAVQALAACPGWPVLMTLLDAEIATIDRELDGQLLESQAAYARALGQRDGLKRAPALLAALVERAETRQEEEQRRVEQAGESAVGVA